MAVSESRMAVSGSMLVGLGAAYSLVSLWKTARMVNCECSAFDDLEVLTPKIFPLFPFYFRLLYPKLPQLPTHNSAEYSNRTSQSYVETDLSWHTDSMSQFSSNILTLADVAAVDNVTGLDVEECHRLHHSNKLRDVIGRSNLAGAVGYVRCSGQVMMRWYRDGWMKKYDPAWEFIPLITCRQDFDFVRIVAVPPILSSPCWHKAQGFIGSGISKKHTRVVNHFNSTRLISLGLTSLTMADSTNSWGKLPQSGQVSPTKQLIPRIPGARASLILSPEPVKPSAIVRPIRLPPAYKLKVTQIRQILTLAPAYKLKVGQIQEFLVQHEVLFEASATRHVLLPLYSSLRSTCSQNPSTVDASPDVGRGAAIPNAVGVERNHMSVPGAATKILQKSQLAPTDPSVLDPSNALASLHSAGNVADTPAKSTPKLAIKRCPITRSNSPSPIPPDEDQTLPGTNPVRIFLLMLTISVFLQRKFTQIFLLPAYHNHLQAPCGCESEPLANLCSRATLISSQIISDDGCTQDTSIRPPKSILISVGQAAAMHLGSSQHTTLSRQPDRNQDTTKYITWLNPHPTSPLSHLLAYCPLLLVMNQGLQCDRTPQNARAESTAQLSPTNTTPLLHSPLPPLLSDEQQHNRNPEQASFSNDIQDAVIKQAAPQDPRASYTAQFTPKVTAPSLPYILPPLPPDEQRHNHHPKQASLYNYKQDTVVQQPAPQDLMAGYSWVQLTQNITPPSPPSLLPPFPQQSTRIATSTSPGPLTIFAHTKQGNDWQPPDAASSISRTAHSAVDLTSSNQLPSPASPFLPDTQPAHPEPMLLLASLKTPEIAQWLLITSHYFEDLFTDSVASLRSYLQWLEPLHTAEMQPHPDNQNTDIPLLSLRPGTKTKCIVITDSDLKDELSSGWGGNGIQKPTEGNPLISTNRPSDVLITLAAPPTPPVPMPAPNTTQFKVKYKSGDRKAKLVAVYTQLEASQKASLARQNKTNRTDVPPAHDCDRIYAEADLEPSQYDAKPNFSLSRQEAQVNLNPSHQDPKQNLNPPHQGTKPSPPLSSTLPHCQSAKIYKPPCLPDRKWMSIYQPRGIQLLTQLPQMSG
ncbi:hypothetical protein VP01_175g2 [Puccinia sorghi]|uniref:Uncharacterized protein n=1 Tax=Puccinia sorghi TaxID=27349 RepID=A0A0L6VEW2_9BASI|nr:hypothetical protein VP01_175g2 [Puccinia sorghi]